MTTKQVLQKVFTAVCLFFSLTTFSQLKQNTDKGSQISLVFNLKVGDAKVIPGYTYTNPFGESYTLQKFRFYITQIQLLDSNDMSTQFFPDDYYLVAESDSTTQTITVPLALKHITSISFLVGVDSIAAVSGTQTGALDPVNGMFWTWNTGYIMMKLQGTSPAAQVPGNAFSLDVGGFKEGENAMRKMEFLTNAPKRQLIHNITLDVDVNKLFNGAYPIKLAEHPLCHEPGQLAMQLADNYATMFSLQKVHK